MLRARDRPSDLAQKLLIKLGDRVLVQSAPDRIADTLAPLPDGAVLVQRAEGATGVVLLFVCNLVCNLEEAALARRSRIRGRTSARLRLALLPQADLNNEDGR